MSVVPPDGSLRIRAYANGFAEGFLHALHISPGYVLLKELRIIVVSIREQCDERDTTKTNTRANDESDAHLAITASVSDPPE